jgi:hypothetical protein
MPSKLGCRLPPSRSVECLLRVVVLRFSFSGEKKGFVCDGDKKREKRSQVK